MKTFQLNIGDWVTSTRHLSPAERGVLFELVGWYYMTEKPLTRDELKRITKTYSPEDRRAFEFVLGKFFTEEDGVFRNAQCDAEIARNKNQSRSRGDRSLVASHDVK